MTSYPLNLNSKGQNKRKVSIADTSDALLVYGEVNIANAHRKPTTLYADTKKKQEITVLTPTTEKKVVTFDIKGSGGQALGSLVLEGGFTTREFEMFDASGNSVGRISGEGVGRELAGAAIGGLVGAAVGGRANYYVTMQSGVTVEITRGRGRSVTVDKTGGDLTPEQEQLLLASLVIWAAYSLN